MTQPLGDPEAIRKRQKERRRKRMRMMKIRRAIFYTVVTLIAVYVILFYTPIFRIRSVEIIGNDKVETTEILECVGDTEGKNLFKAKTSAMKKAILKIPYIESAKIDRIILRSKLEVTVTECEEAASISGGSGYIIIDSGAKVLAETTEKPQGIPEITGLSVTNIAVGERLIIGADDEERFDVMLMCLDEMKKIDILNGVTTISVADIGNITFNYENRLDAICGSNVDLAKKLGFFKSAVNSAKLNANSRGTIDLSTIGKAIYTP